MISVFSDLREAWQRRSFFMCKKVNFKAFLSEKKNHYFFMIWIKCAKLLISKDVSPVRLLLCEAKIPCFKYFFLKLNLDSIIHCYNTLFDHRIRTYGERITICFIPCIFMLFSCEELYSCKRSDAWLQHNLTCTELRSRNPNSNTLTDETEENLDWIMLLWPLGSICLIGIFFARFSVLVFLIIRHELLPNTHSM